VTTLHVGLRVADLERSHAFHTSLGYEVFGGGPETEFGSLTMLKLPGDEFVSLGLIHDPARGPGMTVPPASSAATHLSGVGRRSAS
jgi:lactoylglutathione lyase